MDGSLGTRCSRVCAARTRVWSMAMHAYRDTIKIGSTIAGMGPAGLAMCAHACILVLRHTYKVRIGSTFMQQ